MAHLVRCSFDDDVVIIQVTAAGPLDLVFSKRKNSISKLPTCLVTGFKRAMEPMDRSDAAKALEALDPTDGRGSMKGMVLYSIGGEDFVHGQTHDSEGMEAKDIPRLLTGPLTFALERKAHYEARKHGRNKDWEQMNSADQEAVVELGWTEETWEEGADTPMRALWSELSEEQRRAAAVLGFDETHFRPETEEEEEEDLFERASSGNVAAAPAVTPKQALVNRKARQSAAADVPPAVAQQPAAELTDSDSDVELFGSAPPDPEPEPTPEDAAANTKAAKMQRAKAAMQAAEPAAEPELQEEPPEPAAGPIRGTKWEKHFAEDGTAYFLDTEMQTTQWEEPQEVAEAMDEWGTSGDEAPWDNKAEDDPGVNGRRWSALTELQQAAAAVNEQEQARLVAAEKEAAAQAAADVKAAQDAAAEAEAEAEGAARIVSNQVRFEPTVAVRPAQPQRSSVAASNAGASAVTTGADLSDLDAQLQARRQNVEQKKQQLLSQQQRMADQLRSAKQQLASQPAAAVSLSASASSDGATIVRLEAEKAQAEQEAQTVKDELRAAKREKGKAEQAVKELQQSHIDKQTTHDQEIARKDARISELQMEMQQAAAQSASDEDAESAHASVVQMSKLRDDMDRAVTDKETAQASLKEQKRLMMPKGGDLKAAEKERDALEQEMQELKEALRGRDDDIAGLHQQAEAQAEGSAGLQRQVQETRNLSERIANMEAEHEAAIAELRSQLQQAAQQVSEQPQPEAAAAPAAAAEMEWKNWDDCDEQQQQAFLTLGWTYQSYQVEGSMKPCFHVWSSLTADQHAAAAVIELSRDHLEQEVLMEMEMQQECNRKLKATVEELQQQLDQRPGSPSQYAGQPSHNAEVQRIQQQLTDAHEQGNQLHAQCSTVQQQKERLVQEKDRLGQEKAIDQRRLEEHQGEIVRLKQTGEREAARAKDFERKYRSKEERCSQLQRDYEEARGEALSDPKAAKNIKEWDKDKRKISQLDDTVKAMGHRLRQLRQSGCLGYDPAESWVPFGCSSARRREVWYPQPKNTGEPVEHGLERVFPSDHSSLMWSFGLWVNDYRLKKDTESQRKQKVAMEKERDEIYLERERLEHQVMTRTDVGDDSSQRLEEAQEEVARLGRLNRELHVQLDNAARIPPAGTGSQLPGEREQLLQRRLMSLQERNSKLEVDLPELEQRNAELQVDLGVARAKLDTEVLPDREIKRKYLDLKHNHELLRTQYETTAARFAELQASSKKQTELEDTLLRQFGELTKTVRFPIQTTGFPIQTTDFPIQTTDLPIKTTAFPDADAPGQPVCRACDRPVVRQYPSKTRTAPCASPLVCAKFRLKMMTFVSSEGVLGVPGDQFRAEARAQAPSPPDHNSMSRHRSI